MDPLNGGALDLQGLQNFLTMLSHAGSSALSFSQMNEQEMRQWLEEDPANVNKIDPLTLMTPLQSAAAKGHANLVCDLVDVKGVDPNSVWHVGLTPLHHAGSAQVASVLIERGADPVLQRTPYDQTALMWHAMKGNEDCVERLLQDARVVEKIHLKRPGTRATALHEACQYSNNANSQARIIQMLLLHGSSPYPRCDPLGMYPPEEVDSFVVGNLTPLEILRRFRSNDHEAIAVLEAALVEPERTYLLCKAHHLNDAVDAMTSAQSQGTTERSCPFQAVLGLFRAGAGPLVHKIAPEEKKQEVLAKTPIYLKERVENERPLPRIDVADPHTPQYQHTADSQAEETTEQAKKQEKLTAVLHYVLGEQAEDGSGKLKKTPRMLPEIFVELLDMMAPHWDPIRGARKEYEELEEKAVEEEEEWEDAQEEEEEGEGY